MGTIALLTLAASLLMNAQLLAQHRPLPAGQRDALETLDNSPRWEQWARVRDGDGSVNAWLVFPQRSEKAPVVVVLHETSALTDWIRAVADQLAAEGFIAIVPDLLSGKAPGGYGSAAVDEQTAIELVRALQMDEVNRRLDAVVRHPSTLKSRFVRSGIKPQDQEIPAPSGKLGFVGFGWGGEVAFQFAATHSGLDAVVVYDSAAPEISDLQSMQAPVLALYGDSDARRMATTAHTEAEMKKLGKLYEQEVYEGVDRGFLRLQDPSANRGAAQQAWIRTVRFLKQYLE